VQSLCPTEDSGADEYGEYVAGGGAVTLRSSGLASAVELVADVDYRLFFGKSTCSTIVRAAPNHMLSLSLLPTSPAPALRRERPKTDFRESCPLRVVSTPPRPAGPRRCTQPLRRICPPRPEAPSPPRCGTASTRGTCYGTESILKTQKKIAFRGT